MPHPRSGLSSVRDHYPIELIVIMPKSAGPGRDLREAGFVAKYCPSGQEHDGGTRGGRGLGATGGDGEADPQTTHSDGSAVAAGGVARGLGGPSGGSAGAGQRAQPMVRRAHRDRYPLRRRDRTAARSLPSGGGEGLSAVAGGRVFPWRPLAGGRQGRLSLPRHNPGRARLPGSDSELSQVSGRTLSSLRRGWRRGGRLGRRKDRGTGR